MQPFKLTAKIYYKNIFLLVSYILFFVASLFYTVIEFMFLINQNSLALDYLRSTLKLSIFFFIFFIFISYEYFYKLKASNLDECVKATNNGLQSVYLNSFWVMLILDFFISLVLFICNIVIYFYLDVNHTEYLVHILLNILINIFGVSLVGILLGMFASLLFNRLKAYLFLILFILLSTTFGELIASTLTETTGIYFYPFYDSFNIFPPSLNWTPISGFGYSVLPYRIELLLFWIFVILALILLKLAEKRKNNLKLLSVVCAIACIINISLYTQPASKIIMNEDPQKGTCADTCYYTKNKQKSEKADFNITDYKLDIKIKKELLVKAVLTVDKTNLHKYKFTLYHGYKVKSITDEKGNALHFEQNSDYINVKNNNKKSISKIVMTYAGSSPKFYSNAQGTSLPGFFCYYPHSGYYKLFDIEQQGFERILLKKQVNFNVSAKSNKKIYCNLPEKSNGLYYGKSDSLTLMSGFLDTTKVNGVEVIYPYLETTEFTPKKIKGYIKENKENGIITDKIKKIFIIPNTNLGSVYNRCAVYSDYMTIQQFLGLSEIYQMQRIDSHKLSLYTLLMSYNSNKEAFRSNLKYESKHANEFEEYYMDVLFAEKIDDLGEDYVLQKSDDYINDENDERTVIEFLKQLQ